MGEIVDAYARNSDSRGNPTPVDVILEGGPWVSGAV
jgi:hypothetical protein